MRRNPDLDGFRGIAICLVLLDHGFGHSVRFAINGWVGVDIFFVLSGFLITSILLGMRQQPRYFGPFYARRTVRIFPAFYLVLLIDAAVSLLVHKPGTAQLWLISATFLTSVLQTHFFAAAQGLAAAVFWNMEALWSVSIEELFYLAWAPLVRFLSTGLLVRLLVAVLCLEPAVRFFMFRMHYPVYSAFAGRLDGLAAGALIAFLFANTRLKPQALRRISNLVLLAMLATDAVALPFLHLRLYTLSFTVAGYLLLAWTTAAALLWLLARQAEATWAQRLLRWRFLQLAGRRSFMLYLINQLLFVPALVWAAQHHASRTTTILTGAVCCVLLFGIAELSWRYFEHPLLARKPAVREPSPLTFVTREQQRRAS